MSKDYSFTEADDIALILDAIGAPKDLRCVDGVTRPLGLGGRLRTWLRDWAPDIASATAKRTHLGNGDDKPRRCGRTDGQWSTPITIAYVNCPACLRLHVEDERARVVALAREMAAGHDRAWDRCDDGTTARKHVAARDALMELVKRVEGG